MIYLQNEKSQPQERSQDWLPVVFQNLGHIEMDALSCSPSLVTVREREPSTGGIIIMDNGLRSNGRADIGVIGLIVVFGVRLYRAALSFIVCHAPLHKVRCGGIAPRSDPSAQGSDW